MLRARFLALALPLASAPAALGQTLVPGDLTFSVFQGGLNSPTAAEFLPDGRVVITQIGGGIRVRPAAGGALINAGTIPVVTSIGEQGLLGLAVDPQFATSNRLYFYYSEPGSPDTNRHRVAWTTINPTTSVVDTANLQVIVQDLYGPANHDGGGIKFGPDGYLYIGVGDTGCNCGCAPGTANNYFPTCLSNANGKILRVDRDGGIPPTNPLVGAGLVPACGPVALPCAAGPQQVPDAANPIAARTQIYNWGFRNPWRFSWDEQTGYLWIGDVGEVSYEEITVSTGRGQHHGWPFREGLHGDPITACPASTGLGTVPETQQNCVDPVFEYAHNGGGASVTGGVFSNHCGWPATYAGRYWFADYTAQFMAVWTLTPDPTTTRTTIIPNSRATILSNAEGVVHFFNGPSAAIYMVSINAGEIWRVAPTTPVSCSPDGGVIDSGFVDSGVEPPDTGVEPPDAGIVPPDAGFPDAGFDDTGFPDTGLDDTGVIVDAGTSSTADAGLVADAGTSSTADAGFVDDAGVVDDAGAVADTGVVGNDAMTFPDALPGQDAVGFPDAIAAQDAAASADANDNGDGGNNGGVSATKNLGGGCGCETSSQRGAGFEVAGLLAAVVVLRKRRSPRS